MISIICNPMSAPLHIGNPVLVLSSMMDHIRLEGGGVDQHLEKTIEEEDSECFVSTHIFYGTFGEDEYVLTYVLSTSFDGWSAKMVIGGRFLDEKIPEDNEESFMEFLEDEGYLELFCADSFGVTLGQFFSRNTLLKSRLYEKLFHQHIVSPSRLGIELWKTIINTGGLEGLKEVWEELFDDEIAYYMRLEDPYCFDISEEYSCAPL